MRKLSLVRMLQNKMTLLMGDKGDIEIIKLFQNMPANPSNYQIFKEKYYALNNIAQRYEEMIYEKLINEAAKNPAGIECLNEATLSTVKAIEKFLSPTLVRLGKIIIDEEKRYSKLETGEEKQLATIETNREIATLAKIQIEWELFKDNPFYIRDFVECYGIVAKRNEDNNIILDPQTNSPILEKPKDFDVNLMSSLQASSFGLCKEEQRLIQDGEE